jgi:hypothetical protein
MAVITQTNATDGGLATTLPRTVLSASDTLTYTAGSKQILVLYNTTAAAVTATIIGSAATTIAPAGYGGTISVAGGKAITVGASATVLVELDDIQSFLQGTISITGGVGLTAHLYV